MDGAASSRVPVVVARWRGRGALVMMSLEEFASWQESIHLKRSPSIVEILRRSIKDAAEAKVAGHDLIELWDDPVRASLPGVHPRCAVGGATLGASRRDAEAP